MYKSSSAADAAHFAPLKPTTMWCSLFFHTKVSQHKAGQSWHSSWRQMLDKTEWDQRFSPVDYVWCPCGLWFCLPQRCEMEGVMPENCTYVDSETETCESMPCKCIDFAKVCGIVTRPLPAPGWTLAKWIAWIALTVSAKTNCNHKMTRMTFFEHLSDDLQRMGHFDGRCCVLLPCGWFAAGYPAVTKHWRLHAPWWFPPT